MNEPLLAPARVLLGSGVLWGNAAVTALASLGLSLGLSLLVVLVLTPRALRSQGPSLAWPERARLAYPVRIAAAQLALFLPLLGALLGWTFAGPLGALSPVSMALLGGVAAAVPAGLVHRVIERMLRAPEVLRWRDLRGMFTTQLLLFPHLWVALALSLAMPSTREGGWTWPEGLGVAVGGVLFVLGATGSGLGVARLLRCVRGGDPRLDAALGRAAAGAALTDIPRGYVARMGMANAFAYPWRRSVVVTAPAMELLTDDQLAAVCAHEVAHLTEAPRVRALRLVAMVLVAAPLVLLRPVIEHHGVKAFNLLLLGCVVALVVARRMRRTMEARADRAGKDQERSPGDYATALEALYRGNLMPVVMPGRHGGHGSLYDRMVAAGAPPGYPRPEPPRRWPTAVAVLGATVTALGVGGALRFGLAEGSGGSDEDRLRAVLMTGGAGRSLGDLAWKRYQDGKADEAVAFYRAALVAEPSLSWNAANLTIVLANEGRCPEAGEAWRIVQTRRRPGAVPVRIEAEARRALVDCAAQRLPRGLGGIRAI